MDYDKLKELSHEQLVDLCLLLDEGLGEACGLLDNCKRYLPGPIFEDVATFLSEEPDYLEQV